jgi:uncharacterized protein (UPF0276 family)
MPDATDRHFDQLPNRPGVGYKPQHYSDILENAAPVEWLEIHAENYMGDGGRPIAQLRYLAERFPISVHGVGLSIGGEGPLDGEHLARLKHLVNWLNPASFSEHLAWSTHDAQFLNDLLPLPYTKATLDQVASHISQVQDVLGRTMLLENPSTYLAFDENEMTEIGFLKEIVARTNCGLLLDVNNVFVSATNQQTNPIIYIDDFPMKSVGEIHLGGHDEDQDDHGALLLIDSHGREVVDPVWALYAHTLDVAGPKPTLIEWDNDVPSWATLAAEAAQAGNVLAKVSA